MHVLLVEDNEVVSELVRAGFLAAGWSVEAVALGRDAQARLAAGQFDAVVLDIELPDTNGFKLLAEIRHRPQYMPVIMLTARSGPTATVAGLEAGADDYMSKPFDVEELAARVATVVRRVGRSPQEVLSMGNLSFNRLTRETTCAGRRLRLTTKEQAFLEQLMLQPGETIARDELLRRVWRMNFNPGSNLMDAHVARLRSKLKSASCGLQVVTRRNEGFALEAIEDQKAAPKEAERRVAREAMVKSARDIGGDTLVRRLVRLFLVTADEGMQRIDMALEREALDVAQTAAHHLLASSAQLRLVRVAALAESLEAAARDGDLAGSRARADDLREALTHARSELNELLTSLPKAPRVAVIDDSEDMRVLLRMVLESRFDVTDYPDATSAIRDMHRFPPDLMMIDLSLPDINGIEALKVIRADEALRNVPAVALTALNPPEGTSFEDQGFDLHVRKPIADTDALVQTLLQLINPT